jgi:hypothetical protein
MERFHLCPSLALRASVVHLRQRNFKTCAPGTTVRRSNHRPRNRAIPCRTASPTLVCREYSEENRENRDAFMGTLNVQGTCGVANAAQQPPAGCMATRRQGTPHDTLPWVHHGCLRPSAVSELRMRIATMSRHSLALFRGNRGLAPTG